MYFEDLELCRYHPGCLDAAKWAVPLRAAGWLEHPNKFPVGDVPAGIVSRLTQLLEQAHHHFAHYRFRGAYECSFCRTGGAGWSQDNLIIPGVGEVYAAPGAIVHYITDHLYRPPAAFLEAVASCPDCGSREYFEVLRRLNGGREPPIETVEQFDELFRTRVESAEKFRRALGIPLMQATRAQVIAAAHTVWPEASFSEDADLIELGEVGVGFDKLGRVLYVR